MSLENTTIEQSDFGDSVKKRTGKKIDEALDDSEVDFSDIDNWTETTDVLNSHSIVSYLNKYKNFASISAIPAADQFWWAAAIQMALNKLWHWTWEHNGATFNVKIDGLYGGSSSNTRNAVRAFQKAYNDGLDDWDTPLGVDGIAWPKTLSSLISKLGGVTSNELIKNPTKASEYRKNGEVYREAWKYDEAIDVYTEEIALEEEGYDYEDAYYYRGDSYYNKGEYGNARDDFAKSVELDEEDMSNHSMYIKSLMANWEYMDGINECRSVINTYYKNLEWEDPEFKWTNRSEFEDILSDVRIGAVKINVMEMNIVWIDITFTSDADLVLAATKINGLVGDMDDYNEDKYINKDDYKSKALAWDYDDLWYHKDGDDIEFDTWSSDPVLWDDLEDDVVTLKWDNIGKIAAYLNKRYYETYVE